MQLNEAGQVVLQTWQGLPGRFLAIELDEFVVMPNHVHGIIHSVGAPFMAPVAPEPTAPLRWGRWFAHLRRHQRVLYDNRCCRRLLGNATISLHIIPNSRDIRRFLAWHRSFVEAYDIPPIR